MPDATSEAPRSICPAGATCPAKPVSTSERLAFPPDLDATAAQRDMPEFPSVPREPAATSVTQPDRRDLPRDLTRCLASATCHPLTARVPPMRPAWSYRPPPGRRDERGLSPPLRHTPSCLSSPARLLPPSQAGCDKPHFIHPWRQSHPGSSTHRDNPRQHLVRPSRGDMPTPSDSLRLTVPGRRQAAATSRARHSLLTATNQTETNTSEPPRRVESDTAYSLRRVAFPPLSSRRDMPSQSTTSDLRGDRRRRMRRRRRRSPRRHPRAPAPGRSPRRRPPARTERRRRSTVPLGS